MELVYLWVEDYKNIKKQGFNFSPRFNCHYDEDKNELAIDENDDYIENFFGKNINVTAIVGKNGSGKSSVITILKDYFILGETEVFFLIYLEKKKIYYFSEYLEIDTVLQNKEPTNFESMFYTAENPYPIMTEEKYHLYSEYLEYEYDQYNYDEYAEYDNSQYYIEDRNDRTTSFNERQLLLKSIHPKLLDKKITSFMLVPHKFNIINFNLKGLAIYILEKIEYSSFENFSFPFSIESIEEYIFDSLDEDNIFEKLLFFDILFEDKLATKYFNEIQKHYGNEIGVYEFIEYIFIFYKKYKLQSEAYTFLSIVKEESFILDELSIYLKNKIFIEYFDFIILDFEDKKERNFLDLSHGEKTLYGLMINLQYKIMNSLENNFLFLLDEPDLSLHPEWQRRFLYEFFFNIKNEEVSIHFILTSHSPFLLSDIPKQNIIFLDKDENGNCKVVDGLKEKKQTFGANIHTLLSDSFFMEDGLMGEFAKAKIDDVINFLNGNKSDIKDNDEAQKMISIIGEPIVKNQLQRMLDSKRLKKVDEIDAIKKSMEAMQKRLEELEK